MEQKLAEFRARRRRQELLETTKNAFTKVFRVASSVNEVEEEDEAETPRVPGWVPPAPVPEEAVSLERRASLLSTSSSDEALEEEEPPENTNDVWFRRVQYLLWFLLWVTVLMLMLQLGLALAYLLISALCLVYFSTRVSKARKPGELSAYSVFNPNCERIDGTLTAEQFEREIRYGALR